MKVAFQGVAKKNTPNQLVCRNSKEVRLGQEHMQQLMDWAMALCQLV